MEIFNYGCLVAAAFGQTHHNTINLPLALDGYETQPPKINIYKVT
jgi:hypothetical protein